MKSVSTNGFVISFKMLFTSFAPTSKEEWKNDKYYACYVMTNSLFNIIKSGYAN